MKKEYSEEFKKESVRLFESGNVGKSQVARELGVNQHTFYNGLYQSYLSEKQKALFQRKCDSLLS